MTARVEGAIEGRPSNARLRASLEDALQANGHLREVNVNLALELRATRLESRAFAEYVAGGLARIRDLVATGLDMAAVNEAGRLGHEAGRRLTQLGSVVL